MKPKLSPEATAALDRINAELTEIHNGSAHGPVPKAWICALGEADWEAERWLVLRPANAEGLGDSFVGPGH